MYLVYRGRLGVFVKDRDNHQEGIEESPHGKQIATLRNGACFGEMAMFGDKRRAATIQAFGFCELESLSFLGVNELQAKFPELKNRMKKHAKLRYANVHRTKAQQQQKREHQKLLKSEAASQKQEKPDFDQYFFGDTTSPGGATSPTSSTLSLARGKTQSFTQSKKKSKRIAKRYNEESVDVVQDIYNAARDHDRKMSQPDDNISEPGTPGIAALRGAGTRTSKVVPME
jgi:CRP-like cAMP-binding protein